MQLSRMEILQNPGQRGRATIQHVKVPRALFFLHSRTDRHIVSTLYLESSRILRAAWDICTAEHFIHFGCGRRRMGQDRDASDSRLQEFDMISFCVDCFGPTGTSIPSGLPTEVRRRPGDRQELLVPDRPVAWLSRLARTSTSNS